MRQTRSGGPTTILFDISEVCISGLAGVERKLAPIVGRPPSDVLGSFAGEDLRQLCRGVLSEDQYIASLLQRSAWVIEPSLVQKHIRANFHWKIAGMKELLGELAGSFDVCLYSDHAREWVAYILDIHPFLASCSQHVFSYDIGLCKDEPGAFEAALARLGRKAEECLFVDDNGANVQAARTAGVSAVQFFSASVLRAALTAQGVTSDT